MFFNQVVGMSSNDAVQLICKYKKNVCITKFKRVNIM